MIAQIVGTLIGAESGTFIQEMNEKAMKGILLAHVDGGVPNLVITVDHLDDCRG